MIAATSLTALAASATAVLASTAFLATMLRYRDDPATRPLIGVAAALVVGALVQLAVVDLAPVRAALGISGAPTDTVGGFWVLVAFDLAAVVGGWWFLFALQYTGRGERASSLAAAVVGVLFVLLAVPTLSLTVLEPFAGVDAGFMNALLGMAVVLAESLAVVGVFLVVASTLRQKAFPAGQTALLALAAATVLTLPFVATTLRTPAATPAAVASSSVLLTAAIHRYRVFETLPVATVAGRDLVIDELSAGVVVTDTDHRVRDLNPAAERLFDADRSAATRQPLRAVAGALPSPDVLAASGPRDVRTDADRVVSVTADRVTDARNRAVGYLLVCRDVTGKRRRENRLAVLTRLVADATQQQLGRVAETADEVVAGDRAPDRAGDHIRETATEVATLVARVRDVERALADREPSRSATADVLETLDRLQTPSGVAVSTPDDSESLPVAADPELLSAALETLAAGAASADEPVTVRIASDGDAVTVAVAPFDRDADGSVAALSLRVANLAAEHAEWTVRAAEGPDDAVTVRLPRAGDATDQRTAAARGDGA